MSRRSMDDFDVGRVYDELTDGRTCPLRVAELVYAAADRYPGFVPTREQMDGERQLLQKERQVWRSTKVSSSLACSETETPDAI